MCKILRKLVNTRLSAYIHANDIVLRKQKKRHEVYYADFYDNNPTCQQDNYQFAGIKNIKRIFIRNVSYNYYFTHTQTREREREKYGSCQGGSRVYKRTATKIESITKCRIKCYSV